MYKKHSFEEKLRCMKLLDEGYPMRRLSKESGIRRNQLYDLRKRYLVYGEEGLRRKERHYATVASVIQTAVKNGQNPFEVLRVITTLALA